MYKELFDLHEEICKTLANHKRLEIIHLLKGKELAVSEMAKMLGLRQANLSQHLMVLRSCGLVSTRRDGTNIYYTLSDDRISKANDLIREFIKDRNLISNKASKTFTERFDALLPIVTDPVCGMRFSHADAYEKLEYNGSVHYFCASGCANKFKKSMKSTINMKVSLKGSI